MLNSFKHILQPVRWRKQVTHSWQVCLFDLVQYAKSVFLAPRHNTNQEWLLIGWLGFEASHFIYLLIYFCYLLCLSSVFNSLNTFCSRTALFSPLQKRWEEIGDRLFKYVRLRNIWVFCLQSWLTHVGINIRKEMLAVLFQYFWNQFLVDSNFASFEYMEDMYDSSACFLSSCYRFLFDLKPAFDLVRFFVLRCSIGSTSFTWKVWHFLQTVWNRLYIYICVIPYLEWFTLISCYVVTEQLRVKRFAQGPRSGWDLNSWPFYQ